MYRTALARTHRPRRFSELVGQDHVAATLRAAVESGHVHHAYLFCGPRGIGKTTAARVLAMALNCPQQRGGEPCGACESCERIWSGRTSLDVVEIDAASNRGVDDARDLRERAMYAPSGEERHKVYIVDEAHMLTREAWNALLKILEEPPPRVIFVFATTDPQKIRQSAEPVLSRVQRFDFHRVSVRDLLLRLRHVLEAEGVTAEEAALIPIARRAEGGVRDALSLLDQVISFSGDSVGLEDVRRMLGLVEEEKYVELFGVLSRGDRGSIFPFVQSLLDEGYDLAEFVQGLGEAFRLVLALRMDPDGGVPELAEESRDHFLQAADSLSEEDLLRMLVATADFEASGRFRRSAQPRVQVEVLLLRLACMDSSVEIRELLEALGGSGPSEATTRGKKAATSKRGERKRHPAPRDAGETRQSRQDDPGGAGQHAPTARGPQTAVAAAEPDVAAPEPPRLRSLWTEALAAARGRGIGGELVGLRGASLEAVDGPSLRLRVPPGLAADLQAYLDDLRRSAALRLELAQRLGIDGGEIRFQVDDGGPRQRMTTTAARDQRLQKMMEADPRLREAVQTLDLKLKE